MRLKMWILLLFLHLLQVNCKNHSDWRSIHETISSCPGKSCLSKDNDLEWQGEEVMNPSANCRCDENCKLYADCCYDSQKFSLNEQYNSSSSFKCVNILNTGVFMIAGCPSGWKKTKIEKACQSQSWEDPLVTLPVTSINNNVTFKNMYCAICNNEKDFIVWDVNLRYFSDDEYDDTSDESIKENLFYNRNTSSWGIQQEDFVELTPYPKMPADLKPYIRQCNSEIIDHCNTNDTLVWKNNEKLCKSYTFVVYDRDGKAYRNPYCALCNDISIEKLNCRKNYDKLDPFVTTRTLRESISFYKTSPFCESKDEVYDVFTKKCRVLEAEITYLEKSLYRSQPSSSYVNPLINRECEKVLIRKEYYVINDDEIFITIFNKSLSFNEVNITKNEEIIVCKSILGINPIFQLDIGEKIVSFIGYTLSIFFLVLHLILFIKTPSKHKLAGKNNASLSLSLIISYVTLLIGNYFVGLGCYIVSIVSCYSLLASFMWMVIISYDIYRSVIKTRAQSQNGSQKRWWRFIYYSLWGWLIPGIIVGGAIFADFSPLVLTDWKPAFGVDSCWFGQKKPLFAFFVVPFIASTILNTILFTRCAITIFIIKSAVKNCCKHSFKLYIRVALAMGLTWTTGLLAMVINNAILWYLFIILNSFQGFIVFISFWDQDIAKAVKGNFYQRLSTKFYLSISTISNSNSECKV